MHTTDSFAIVAWFQDGRDAAPQIPEYHRLPSPAEGRSGLPASETVTASSSSSSSFSSQALSTAIVPVDLPNRLLSNVSQNQANIVLRYPEDRLAENQGDRYNILDHFLLAGLVVCVVCQKAFRNEILKAYWPEPDVVSCSPNDLPGIAHIFGAFIVLGTTLGVLYIFYTRELSHRIQLANNQNCAGIGPVPRLWGVMVLLLLVWIILASNHPMICLLKIPKGDHLNCGLVLAGSIMVIIIQWLSHHCPRMQVFAAFDRF